MESILKEMLHLKRNNKHKHLPSIIFNKFFSLLSIGTLSSFWSSTFSSFRSLFSLEYTKTTSVRKIDIFIWALMIKLFCVNDLLPLQLCQKHLFKCIFKEIYLIFRWAWTFRTSLFIDYYNGWNGFNNNKNASFFFVFIETPYCIIGFLLKTPVRPYF